MRLSKFAPHIDPATLEDCEVVGVHGDCVVHFNSETGEIYQEGLTLQDWKNGSAETWCLTEAEASRLGITDYAAYVADLKDRNPKLVGEAGPTP